MDSLICFVAELSSGPKGRRAEPHNYRARIEIRKPMRLSFHGHLGSRARAPSDDDDDDVAQNGGHTLRHTPEKVSPGHLTCLILTIHLSLKVTYRRSKVCRTLLIFLNHVENRLRIFHFAYTNRLREKATKSLAVAQPRE